MSNLTIFCIVLWAGFSGYLLGKGEMLGQMKEDRDYYGLKLNQCLESRGVK